MNYLFTLLLIAALVFFGVAQVFRTNFEQRIEQQVQQAIAGPATTTPTQGIPTSASPTPLFHGPTGQPRIIGPKGNPPNY